MQTESWGPQPASGLGPRKGGSEQSSQGAEPGLGRQTAKCQPLNDWATLAKSPNSLALLFPHLPNGTNFVSEEDKYYVKCERKST